MFTFCFAHLLPFCVLWNYFTNLIRLVISPTLVPYLAMVEIGFSKKNHIQHYWEFGNLFYFPL